jgi:hypothetical protein
VAPGPPTRSPTRRTSKRGTPGLCGRKIQLEQSLMRPETRHAGVSEIARGLPTSRAEAGPSTPPFPASHLEPSGTNPTARESRGPRRLIGPPFNSGLCAAIALPVLERAKDVPE